MSQTQSSYKQLHLRKTVAKLFDNPHLEAQRQEAWLSIKDQKVTLFGLAKNIVRNKDRVEITVHNTRLGTDGFNMQVIGLDSASHKQPLIDHIIIFKDTISSYIAGGSTTYLVLIIDNANILDVFERKQEKGWAHPLDSRK
ncbi:MAG: hypothetical protein HQL06_09920 [Nitrospirae bacterium]|nr:hypothetical protein [Nitrospirota bacterium]